MLNWFNTDEVDRFADAIVTELQMRCPPSGVERPGDKAFVRLRKGFAQLFAKVDAFARAGALNVYRKARLGNRVKWALAEAGYPEEFVELFTRELIVHVALESRKGTKGKAAG